MLIHCEWIPWGISLYVLKIRNQRSDHIFCRICTFQWSTTAFGSKSLFWKLSGGKAGDLIFTRVILASDSNQALSLSASVDIRVRGGNTLAPLHPLRKLSQFEESKPSGNFPVERQETSSSHGSSSPLIQIRHSLFPLSFPPKTLAIRVELRRSIVRYNADSGLKENRFLPESKPCE
jgi:hypothetical protein